MEGCSGEEETFWFGPIPKRGKKICSKPTWEESSVLEEGPTKGEVSGSVNTTERVRQEIRT